MKTSLFRLNGRVALILAIILAGQFSIGAIEPPEGYLGQVTPGLQAEVFAPGIVSLPGRYEYAVSIAPDGHSLLFTVEVPKQSSIIMMAEKQEKGWGVPQALNFIADPVAGEFEGFFSRDGQSVFFAVSGESDCHIWQVRRAPKGWSDPEKLGSTVNTGIVFYPVQAGDGSLYFTDVKKRKAMFATWQNGAFQEATPVGIPFGGHTFLSADDRFLLCDSGGDIFISQRQADGSWSTPRALPAVVNTKEFDETCPSLSPDGRFLFFSRYNEPGGLSNIYWISAEILRAPETLEPNPTPEK